MDRFAKQSASVSVHPPRRSRLSCPRSSEGTFTNRWSRLATTYFCSRFFDSYGGSLHRVFVLHYLPVELLRAPATSLADDPLLISTLRDVRRKYQRAIGHWGMVAPSIVPAAQLQALSFLTNIHDFSKEEYERRVVPQYEAVARKNKLRRATIYVGSYDSLLDLSAEATIAVLGSFLKKHSDGVRISVGDSGIAVARYATESVLAAGVPKGRPLPLSTCLRGRAQPSRSPDRRVRAPSEQFCKRGAA